MNRIKYTIGDASEVPATGWHIITHCVSDNGRSYGKGFALQLGRKYPYARMNYKRMAADGELQGGMSLSIFPVDGRKLQIVDLVAQHGLGRQSLRLEWLDLCMHFLVVWAIETNATIHMPRIGCGLAGGKWEDVEAVILKTFNQPLASLVPIIVYDLPKP